MTILQDLQEFYKDRNVFITGITGFKGTWLALILHELGANVDGFGLKPDNESLCNIMDIKNINGINYSFKDLQDIHSAKDAQSLITNNPDVILHLAAQPIVSEGYRDPFYTYNVNIMGTVAMHEAARALNKRVSFVNVTTDKVYAEGDTPRDEQDRLQGLDPYSLSKSCSDMISQSYKDAFDSEVIISEMRAGNVLGGGDFSKNRIITDYINAYRTHSKLSLRHPESIRPYQYVFDVVIGYAIQAMRQYQDPKTAGSFNIGPSTEQISTTLNVAETMNVSMDNDVEIEYDGSSIGHENPLLLLNSDKFRTQAHWQPSKKTIEDVLNSTALWYNVYCNNKERIQTFTNQQVKETLNQYDY